jgi:hypothetical protein
MKTKTKKSVKVNSTFDYKTIKTFEDACKKLDINPVVLPDVLSIPEEFAKPIIAVYKLMIIYKAINNGWKPNWSDRNEYKYYPWLSVLSSVFGFSYTCYYFVRTSAIVGSRLCTDTREKALYIGNQFEAEYKDFFFFQNN